MKPFIHLLMKTNLPFSQSLAKILFSLFFFISVPAYSQNEAPVLSGIESSNLSYTENQIPINITDSIIITDLDDINIESATVKITDNYQNGEDILSFVNTLTITGFWSAGDSSLTLAGPASIDEYITALKNVAYQNTSDNPSAFARKIIFTVFDGDDYSNKVSRNITVNAVNDAPLVDDIPGQTVAEGASFATISLDTYVSDIETSDANIAWTYSGNNELTVSIVNRMATITIPNADWNGSETITFIATDDDASNPLSDSDDAAFTVTAANEAPVVTDIPGQTINEGATFVPISLDAFVSDDVTPDANIAWALSGNSNLNGSITDRVATITVPNANWNGSETITFTATDNDASNPLSDSDVATFSVTAINDVPIVANIPDQTVAEGSSFASINLDDFVSDTETPDANIAWTYSGNDGLTVSIVNRVATITIPNADWNGSETITFTATDDDASPTSDSDDATFTVTAVNDAPVITEGTSVSVTCDENNTPTAFALTLHATDPENDVITWSVSTPASHGTAAASGTGASKVISYSPVENFYGSDSFIISVSDNNGGTDNITVNVTVNPVNDAPVVTDIPGQTIVEGDLFVPISRDNYVSDAETPDANIAWT
jgi:hypothetical protein